MHINIKKIQQSTCVAEKLLHTQFLEDLKNKIMEMSKVEAGNFYTVLIIYSNNYML